MVKSNKLVLSAFTVFVLLVGGNVCAKQPGGAPPNNCAPDCVPGSVRQNVNAPEIDVSSGGSAIALLITAMLIASERRRRT